MKIVWLKNWSYSKSLKIYFSLLIIKIYILKRIRDDSFTNI